MDALPPAAGLYGASHPYPPPSFDPIMGSSHPQQQQQQQQHGRRGDTGVQQQHGRDQQQQLHDLLSLELPISYAPFKFEARRVRIDWRLLHGVDIAKLVRDTDLDSLEQLVSCITWGDIEAEDTRHLGEASFVKVFRLAQLLLEYLLYVQDSLRATNSVLDASRSAAVLHAQSLTSRCRDLYAQLKHCKRELKRSQKSVKTFELMAAAVGGAAAAAQAAATHQQQAAPAPTQQQQPQAEHQQQAGVGLTSGELLLQSQLMELTERLTLAVCEAERLRGEREELQYQIRHLHDTLSAKLSGSGGGSGSSAGGSWSRLGSSNGGSTAAAATAAAADAERAAAQHQAAAAAANAELQDVRAELAELHADNKALREQLQRQSKAVADAADAESTVAALRAQLKERSTELAALQGELHERDASIKVFQTSNAALEQQLDALQRQLASPEAAAPSFVAKQRQQLAASEAMQTQLRGDNAALQRQVVELRVALEAAADPSVGGGSRSPGAAAAASPPSPGSDWKVQEIERLQQENRLLQGKAASLQERVHELERLQAGLERRHADAAAEAAADDGQHSGSPTSAPGAVPGWTSVSSSGPVAELTAADLAAGEPGAGQQAHSPSSASPAVPEGGKQLPAAKSGSVLAGSSSQEEAGGIPAYRPSPAAAPTADSARPAPAAAPAPAASAAAAANLRGSIDQAAANQLRALVAQMGAEMAPEQVAQEAGELASDWDKPFDLTDEEKADFRRLLPHEADGLPHVLTAAPMPGAAITAAKARLLPAIGRQLDVQLASFGLHPGRTGLSQLELLAVMKMLGERRAAREAPLSQGQRDQLEVARLALMLHPYHALQASLAAQPEGADGRRHLPPQEPALVSGVRPPPGKQQQQLAPGLTPIRVSQPDSGRDDAALPAPQAPTTGSSIAPSSPLMTAAAAGAMAALPLRAPSLLGCEAAQDAISHATASGSFSPMRATLQAKQAKQQLLGAAAAGKYTMLASSFDSDDF